MKHFWLEPEQQLIMNAATATSPQYGYVAIMKLDTKEDINFREVTSKPFPATEYMTSYGLARMTRAKTPFNAVFRLNKQQSLLFNLKYRGTSEGVLIPDPTGECWGNLSICRDGLSTALRSVEQLKRENLKRLSDNVSFDRTGQTGIIKLAQFHRKEAGLAHILMMTGGVFGPTIATVVDHCKGLPLSWAKPFVWNYAAMWNHAATAVTVPDTQIVGDDLFTIDRDAFSAPIECLGQKWARDWWNSMQLVKNRRAVGIIDVPNDTTL